MRGGNPRWRPQSRRASRLDDKVSIGDSVLGDVGRNPSPAEDFYAPTHDTIYTAIHSRALKYRLVGGVAHWLAQFVA